MTPDEFNQAVSRIIDALDGTKPLGTVSAGVPADDDGTLPEIYVDVDGVDLCLTVSPL